MQLVKIGEPRRFTQIWESGATGEWVVREGTLGRAGRLRETGLRPDATPIEELAAPYLAKGYVEFDEDDYDWVVIQFPCRDSRYDQKLLERASERLDVVLDERGLGYVDGYDWGMRGGDGEEVINIYALVKDGELGAVGAKAALRQGGADHTRASIAYRARDAEDWTLRYERSAGKLPGPFTI